VLKADRCDNLTHLCNSHRPTINVALIIPTFRFPTIPTDNLYQCSSYYSFQQPFISHLISTSIPFWFSFCSRLLSGSLSKLSSIIKLSVISRDHLMTSDCGVTDSRWRKLFVFNDCKQPTDSECYHGNDAWRTLCLRKKRGVELFAITSSRKFLKNWREVLYLFYR